MITPKSGMSFCPYEEPIGNLRDSDPSELWESHKAIEARKKINACTQKCFIPFCSWNEKERRGRFYEMFVKPNKPGSLQPTNK
jgi:hypothetical protein